MKTTTSATWATRLPAVLLLCLSIIAFSHSSPQRGQSHQSRGRVEAQQQDHPLEYSVPDRTLPSFMTHSFVSSPPLLLNSPPLRLLRRRSETRTYSHGTEAGKTKKKQHQGQEKHYNLGLKADCYHSESSSRTAKKLRKKLTSMKGHRAAKKGDDTEHGYRAEKKAKTGTIKTTSGHHKMALSPSAKKAATKTFRQSIYHKHGKQYLFTHEDWYTQYRRNRAGPSSVMRKLTLESTRRRKAVVTIEPVVPIDDDSVGSIEQEYGSPKALPSALRGYGVVGGQDGEEEGTEVTGHNEASIGNDSTTEIQAVKRLPAMGAGLVPRPVIVRPAGLVPKSRSNGGSSARMASSRDTAVRTSAIAAVVAVALFFIFL